MLKLHLNKKCVAFHTLPFGPGTWHSHWSLGFATGGRAREKKQGDELTKFHHLCFFLFHDMALCWVCVRGLWEHCVNLISTMRCYGMAPNETLDFCL